MYIQIQKKGRHGATRITYQPGPNEKRVELTLEQDQLEALLPLLKTAAFSSNFLFTQEE